MYIPLATAFVIITVVAFVPYRPVQASAYNKVRFWAFLTLVAPAVWAAMVIFDICRSESYCTTDQEPHVTAGASESPPVKCMTYQRVRPWQRAIRWCGSPRETCNQKRPALRCLPARPYRRRALRSRRDLGPQSAYRRSISSAASTNSRASSRACAAVSLFMA
jgi:hypothetical protein